MAKDFDIKAHAAIQGRLPAFANENNSGLCLRDYIAVQALAGLLACKDFNLFGADTFQAEVAAENAYELADAMLLARVKH